MGNPLELLAVLVICGFLAYLFERLVPIEGTFRLVIRAIAGLFLFLYILSWLGIHVGRFGHLPLVLKIHLCFNMDLRSDVGATKTRRSNLVVSGLVLNTNAGWVYNHP